MSVSYQVQIGLKEDGGLVNTPWNKTISIVRGQQCKIGAVLLDLSGRPVTITGYMIKLRFPTEAGPALVKDHVAVDNVKGECEFELLPADTLLLLVGVKQNLEFEIIKTTNVKSFHPLKAVFEVLDQLIAP